MPQIVLPRYDLSDKMWGDISFESANRLAEAANMAPLHGMFPQRYTLTNCSVATHPFLAIYGYFLQEYERPQTKIREDKSELRGVQDDTEKYIFVVVLNAGIAALQMKRVKYGPKRHILEQHFAEALRDALATQQLRMGELAAFKEEPTRADFLQAFTSKDETRRVTFLQLRDFTDALPPEFKFFNPKEDYDIVMRNVILSTRDHASCVTYSAKDGGDLREIPEVRGLIRMAHLIGELHRITVTGVHQILRRKEGISLVVSEETASEHISDPDAHALVAATGDTTLVHSNHAPRTRKPRVTTQPSPFRQERLFT